MIPVGLCQCGCRKPTHIAAGTDMSTCPECADLQRANARLQADKLRLGAINRDLRRQVAALLNHSWGGHIWERIDDSRVFQCTGCGVKSEVTHDVLLTCEELRKHRDTGRRRRYQPKGA